MEIRKVGTKKRSPDSLAHPSQNTIHNNKHNILFYKVWKKHNEFQLTKNKLDFNN